MKKKHFTLLKIILGIAFAILGLYIFFRDVSLPRLVHELSDLKLPIILMCIILPVASLWFRSLRLKLILPQSESTHKKGIFDLVLIEFAVNNMLPGRIGEASRAILLWKRNKFSLAVSIGSLIIERLFDMIVVASFFIVPVLFMPKLAEVRIPLAIGSHAFSVGLDTAGVFLLIAICGIALLFGVYAYYPVIFKRFFKKVISFLPRSAQHSVIKQGHEIKATLGWLSDYRRVAGIVVLSICIELAYAASFYLLIGPPNGNGALGALFAQAFGSLGAAIPLAPGYIGTLHAMLLEAFTLLGHDPDKGRAVAIIYHAIGFLVVTPIGIFCMIRSHTPLREIQSAAEEMKPLEEKLID